MLYVVRLILPPLILLELQIYCNANNNRIACSAQNECKAEQSQSEQWVESWASLHFPGLHSTLRKWGKKLSVLAGRRELGVGPSLTSHHNSQQHWSVPASRTMLPGGKLELSARGWKEDKIICIFHNFDLSCFIVIVIINKWQNLLLIQLLRYLTVLPNIRMH